MENNNIYCTECGEKNSNEYQFCKNCGAPLKKAAPIKSELADNGTQTGGYNANNTYNAYNAYTASYGTEYINIDGIPKDEIALFVGKKAPDIVRKFDSMQLSNSKVSWCWPVAVLSFFFGPLGAALWFFYRKMYKNAFILAAIGAVTTVLLTILRGDYLDLSEVIESGVLSVGELANAVSNWRTALAESLDTIINITCAVLLGIFSFNIYKGFVVNRIKEYRQKNSDPRYYRMGISVVGGTSGGMVWVGILLIFSVNALSNILNQLFMVIF